MNIRRCRHQWPLPGSSAAARASGRSASGCSAGWFWKGCGFRGAVECSQDHGGGCEAGRPVEVGGAGSQQRYRFQREFIPQAFWLGLPIKASGGQTIWRLQRDHRPGAGVRDQQGSCNSRYCNARTSPADLIETPDRGHQQIDVPVSASFTG